MEKNKVGRPTTYNEEILTKTEQYIKNCIDQEIEFHKTRGEKSDSYERIVKVNLPTIEGLALYLNVARSSIYLWIDEHKDFSDIIEKLQAKQAEMLINSGLSGSYNPTIAKVLLTKHGYREGNEVTGKDGEKLIPETLTNQEQEALRKLVK